MKRALVTGGSGAIGTAICHTLAADGMHVIVHANSRLDAAQVLAEEIRQQGGKNYCWMARFRWWLTTLASITMAYSPAWIRRNGAA
jgi:NAD(P)-dependent dehydrogenase (short-subunit alcohol dehydrogenase family)